MKVLIAGGTTWFGQTIVKRLQLRGHDVVALDFAPVPWRLELPRPVPVHCGSAADLGRVLEIIRLEKPDAIVNREVFYGAETEDQLFSTMQRNIVAAVNLFEAAAATGIRRVVYESSIGVYGTQDEQGDRPIVEDDARISDGSYVFRLTQHVAEFFARRYSERTGVEIVGTRPSVCHSPLKDAGLSRWSNDIVSLPAIGKRADLPYPREQRNSIVWVEDAADVYAALADHPSPKYDVYNSGGYDLSLQEFAERIRDVIPGAEFTFAEEGVQPMPANVDQGRAREDLGLTLRPLEETLLEHAEMARKLYG